MHEMTISGMCENGYDMTRRKWATRRPASDMYKLLTGRDRYNKDRQDAAELRRMRVYRYIQDKGMGLWAQDGMQRAIARDMGIPFQTVWRDIQALRKTHGYSGVVCPWCGRHPSTPNSLSHKDLPQQ